MKKIVRNVFALLLALTFILCRMLPKSTVRRWNAITNLVIDKVYCYGIENR